MVQNKLIQCGTSTYKTSCFTTSSNMIKLYHIPSPQRRPTTNFVIIAIYVDDFNFVGTQGICNHAISLFSTQFEMKLLGLKVAYLFDGSIFLHQTTYIQILLKRFHMDQPCPFSAPMMDWSRMLDDPYHPCEEEEEFYDKNMYLAAIGTLLYLSTYTRMFFLPQLYLLGTVR